MTVTGNVGWQTSGTVGLPERGAGIFVGQSASVTLGGAIVTSNFDRDGSGGFTTYQPSDCDGLVVSSDYNIRGTTCPLTGQLAHSLVGTGYDQPAFNGGFFRDIATDSTPAQGAIPPSACLDLLGAPLTTDARGHRRKALGCDIGAHDAGARYAPPQLLGVNLVRNGGATGQELGLAGSVANPADVELYQAPFWAQPSGQMVQILYGAPDGYPTQANAPPGSGHKFFAGGVQAVTNAYQSIDVSAIATQIDAGNLPYEISGSFGGYLTDEDRAALVVEFDGVGGFLDEFTMGGFSAADRGNQTRLIKAQRTGVLPVGTRFIYLGLSFERFNGTANDGYADGISLTLPEPGLAVGLASTLSMLAGLARRRRRADRASRRRRKMTGGSPWLSECN